MTKSLEKKLANFPWPFSKRRSRFIYEEIESIRRESEVRLNLGSGEHPILGFVNVDLFSDKADIRCDVLNLETFVSQSVDLIENHHLFEHLSFEDAGKALKEWFRVLRPGGYLIITCPNITHIACMWVFETLKIYLGIRSRREDIKYMFYGPQTNPGMFHRAGYDHQSIRDLVLNAGFRVSILHTPFPERPTPSMVIIARKIV